METGVPVRQRRCAGLADKGSSKASSPALNTKIIWMGTMQYTAWALDKP